MVVGKWILKFHMGKESRNDRQEISERKEQQGGTKHTM